MAEGGVTLKSSYFVDTVTLGTEGTVGTGS